MKDFLPKNLIALAKALPAPLYVVGGFVRDFIADFRPARYDFDLASSMDVDTIVSAATKTGFSVCATYKNTGTVKLKDHDGQEYEYTRFRHDKYVRGLHTPAEIRFTDDIEVDARRRDFTVGAIYYDIQRDSIVDPLGGAQDVRDKIIRTVDKPEKVFGEDGLRLMRLARQAAQLGFVPTADCLEGARQNARLIRDISKERILTELNLILSADEKYGNKTGHYDGLKILEEIGVFSILFPELALGKGQQQRKDFHRYDVLEHSFRVVLYAPKKIRLAALLHDVGKPFCYRRDGNTFSHPQEGAPIADEILQRLGAPNKQRAHVTQLVALHMYDFNCQTGEDKLRRFFVDNYPLLEDVMLLKQADFSGCMDNLSPAPTVVRWRALLAEMERQKAPLTLKQLAVDGKDLVSAGVEGKKVGEILQKMLRYAAVHPQDNRREKLLRLLNLFNA
ncbi:MAG: CCA tRNA nucleotidyltransferase [Clostridia bacterium]|nr:CCA tRNA nucleotidyltransferase [Clostridia bacterium]